MKYIIRIIGIFVTGILLFFTVVFIIEMSDEPWGHWEWRSYVWLISFFMVWLYLVGTKFGFQIQESRMNVFYKISCIYVIVLSFGTLSNFIVQDYRNDQKEEKERVKDSIESAKLMEVIDWEKDTTVFFIQCQLRTRFKKKRRDLGEMEYVFKSVFLKEIVDVEKYVVILRDKNAFKINDFEITLKTDLWDSKKKRIGGAYAEGKIDLSKESYKAIDRIDVAIQKK